MRVLIWNSEFWNIFTADRVRWTLYCKSLATFPSKKKFLGVHWTFFHFKKSLCWKCIFLSRFLTIFHLHLKSYKCNKLQILCIELKFTLDLEFKTIESKIINFKYLWCSFWTKFLSDAHSKKTSCPIYLFTNTKKIDFS